jgi:hypothetical protein
MRDNRDIADFHGINRGVGGRFLNSPCGKAKKAVAASVTDEIMLQFQLVIPEIASPRDSPGRELRTSFCCTAHIKVLEKGDKPFRSLMFLT